ncbi:Nucleotide-binding oligomerization domain-containing protein 1 (Caspase recruitment domain-containing protein 4) [Durusdinium trenchii]|uniref:Nucleotide-binding oligomerization domain-containing protein 1 (Caspase recruitment domain-containing protein 4) n=1 Tax=Durusdinium trenchii TaxID=1381693 RepID=A0ABP0KZ26_9DINO
MLGHDVVLLHCCDFVQAPQLFRLQLLCHSVRRRLQAPDVWRQAFASEMRFISCDLARGMAPLVSKMPPDLPSLSLRFRWCSLGLDSATLLARHLPRGARRLQLAFRGCGLGEAAATALAERMPPELESLYLTLRGCPIGGRGVKAVAEHLPKQLKELGLDFRDCRLPGIGLRYLAQQLQQAESLQQLRLQVGGCDMAAMDCKVIMSQLPHESLRILHLGFESCALGCAGARAMAEALPQQLEVLHLDLDWCNVQAEGASALARHLPPFLRRLWLGLSGCSVGREGATALAKGLRELTLLERCHLDFSRCRIASVGCLRLLEALPQSLTALLLDVRGCAIHVEERGELRDLLPEGLEATLLF